MTLSDALARVIVAADLTEEERQSVRRMMRDYRAHLNAQGYGPLTNEHLHHAMVAAIGTALVARGEGQIR